MALREDWWRGAVIYQVYPRSFADSNGDGIGDLAGLTERLDHIAALGVDAIWLCPVYAGPQRDFGYDVSDHCAIDPAFGTLKQFDRFLAVAHSYGLKVLVDLVAGHTSDRHPWFDASRRSGANLFSDWYVWADPAPDGTPPNNWLSVFGGPAWAWEPRRRQYYLHHFLSSQPTLNLNNPMVVEAVLDVAEFWLERGVDGFRIDAVDFLTHDPLLRSNPAQPVAQVPARLFGMQRHEHDMVQPQTREVLGQLRALLDRYPGRVALGECSAQDGDLSRIAGYTAGGQLLHMAYTLSPLRQGFDHASIAALLRDAIATCATGWPCWSFSNHDVERAASRWAPDGVADTRLTRLLLALLLSLPGSACLYQGEELGLPEARLGAEQIRDPFGMAYWPEFKGRDGSRTPMPWHADRPAAGFTVGTPWLPVPEEHQALAVDVQATDPASTLAFTRGLLARRRVSADWRSNEAELLELPAPLIGFRRGAGALALFNLSSEAVALPPGLHPGAPARLEAWGFTLLERVAETMAA